MLGASVRKMKVLTVKMETATLIWHALCIKCMKLIVKYFFLADFYLWEVILDLDEYIFP
jgi:hypothetical protein